jgi:hypothetical protein
LINGTPPGSADSERTIQIGFDQKRVMRLVAPQGSTSIDFTGVIAFFNGYTPMRTPVCLLLNWLVRFPDLLALPSTDLDITAVLQLITIRAT